jgi:hypothetical protein
MFDRAMSNIGQVIDVVAFSQLHVFVPSREVQRGDGRQQSAYRLDAEELFHLNLRGPVGQQTEVMDIASI